MPEIKMHPHVQCSLRHYQVDPPRACRSTHEAGPVMAFKKDFISLRSRQVIHVTTVKMALGAANQKKKSAEFHISSELKSSHSATLFSSNLLVGFKLHGTGPVLLHCSSQKCSAMSPEEGREIVAQTRRSTRGRWQGTAPRTEQSRFSYTKGSKSLKLFNSQLRMEVAKQNWVQLQG